MVKNSIYFAFLIFILGCNPWHLKVKKECREIKKYVSVEIQAINKTIKMGDTLFLEVKYCNISDTLIDFYPINTTFLIKPNLLPLMQFKDPEHGSAFIYKYLDSQIKVKLYPGKSYVCQYKVISYCPFFSVGSNVFQLYYIYHTPKKVDIETKDTIKFCGSLESKNFEITVK
jgi:hypothetical protein